MMRMKSNFRGISWVELTDQNIFWITKAIAFQVDEGGHRSKRAKVDADSSDASDDVDEPGDTEALGPVCVPVNPKSLEGVLGRI